MVGRSRPPTTGKRARSTDEGYCNQATRSDELVSCGAFVTPPPTVGLPFGSRKTFTSSGDPTAYLSIASIPLPTDCFRFAFMRTTLGGKMGLRFQIEVSSQIIC